ncbi:MAG: DNA primase small subunit PriS [Candidatus Bathyarchaeia archaeon]
MILPSLTFVKDKFAQYYQENHCCITVPASMEKREFGFALFEGQMLRHNCFREGEELKAFLRTHVPSDAYFSCAYYESPEADMDKKGWLGADLIFDIDADHIATPCGKIHDTWSCGTCGFDGKGLVPEKCPICGGQKFDAKAWPCEACLKSAGDETAKLVDMLLDDFGFSEKDVRVFYSGHRGYHVHVEDEAIRTLDVTARKEIVDYVCALGLDTGFIGPDRKGLSKANIPNAPHLDDPGWRGRIAKCMYDLIKKSQREDYTKLGLKSNLADTIVRNRETILKSWSDVGPYRAMKGVGYETWRRITDHCQDFLSAKVDTVVTTDIHRLIRLTGALHGKTGLKKMELPKSNIENFDPFKEAVAFKKGNACVHVSEAPKFSLGGEAFGPYKNQKVELPTAAAILLICKKRAEVAEQNV